MKELPPLPTPRGPLTDHLIGRLTRDPHELAPIDPEVTEDPLSDDDLHLALYLLYELHYRGLPGVDDRWEWEPSVLALRRQLEGLFERALLDAVPLERVRVAPEDMDLALRAIAEEDSPPLSRYIKSQATLDEVREFVVHRSAYQLKEADPHSWAIPRLSGAPKAALVEIQTDEYGRGRPDWMHAELFARAMRALSLDDTYGAYLALIPGLTLATVNLMSLFGLHRRWRGAIVGHLALFEMTSSIPNRRYADGLRRLGLSGDATLFFDEHVAADAVHENIAAVDLAGGLARQEAATAPTILWGARTLALLDARWAGHLLGCWERDETSLRSELQAVGSPEAHELMGPVAERLQL
ncbi:MAG: iron-containing redox enzyme family protein [Solirubrobacteraceae bacterium]